MTNISLSPGVPRLQQPQATINTLRDRIRDGHYGVGDRLPAQRELTEDLRVHRRVVRAAMTQLEKEGLLVRRRNSRPVVQAIPSDTPHSRESNLPSSGLVALVIHHTGSHEREGSEEQRIFWGMSQELGRAGFHAVFLDLGDPNGQEDAEVDAAHLQYALEHGFGGIVFYSYSGDQNRDLIREVSRRMPLVLIDRIPLGIDADFVGMENFQAVFDATQYLIELGHRRVAYVTTAAPINTVQSRLAGYLKALGDTVQGDLGDMVILTPAAGKHWPIFDAVFRLPADERPTAVICVNDYEAVRVAETVPSDASVKRTFAP